MHFSYLSCPEIDDNDSDSTENTLKLSLSGASTAAKLPPKKSCLKKLSSIENCSARGNPIITPESSHKQSSGNKSNRISIKFAEDSNHNEEIKTFSLDCTSLQTKKTSSDMELNPSYGMRSHLSSKLQPKSQVIPFKDPKSDLNLDDFILEVNEEDDLKFNHTVSEVVKKPSRSKSSSSIFEKLREKSYKLSGEESD